MVVDSQLASIDFWRRELGLLPVPLYQDFSDDNSFVMLNGARGNFCLDLERHYVDEKTRSTAWSSNVGHYLAITNSHIEVQRWDQRRSTIERYTHKSVVENLEKFHAYLEKDFPQQGTSVIAHTIQTFRRLRGILGNHVDGQNSLRAFLYLLACATDGTSKEQLRVRSWRLMPEAAQIANTIDDYDWEALINELVQGRLVDSLVPDLSLVLRHASGQLFQEAHYEAIFFSQEQMRFEGFLPAPVRVKTEGKNQGLHFTPPALARTLVEEALGRIANLNNRAKITVFDPACGSGEFLRESLRQLKLKKFTGEVALIGWDISQAACDMANFALAWESRDARDTLSEVNITIEQKNSLHSSSEWPEEVDAILMNPPFVSWMDMGEEQRGLIESTLGKIAKYRPDLAFAFLYKAALCLKKSGVLGTIIPSLILDGQSARPLREELREIIYPSLIAKLGSHSLFSNATVDASLLVASNETKNPTVAFWADYRAESNSAGLRALRKVRFVGRDNVYPVLGDGYSIYHNPYLVQSIENWAPRPYDAWTTLQSLKDFSKVKDFFDVRMGALTGNNQVFLLSQSELLQLPKKEQKYFRPAIVNDSVVNGHLNRNFYVFFPYGNLQIREEEKLKTFVPSYYDKYLLPNKRHLEARSSIAAWWELSRHRSWQIDEEVKLVSTYFGEAGSFAFDSQGDFVVVQGMAWLPKGLEAGSKLSRDFYFSYLAILNSQFFSFLLSSISNQVRGGQWNLSPRFINNVPLPNLSDSSPSIVSALSPIGEMYLEGIAFEIEKEKLEDLVKVAYGLGKS